MMPSNSSTIHGFSTLSTADAEFLVECSTRYCLGRYSYAPNWMCGILSKCLATLSDGCLSVIERDIREHLRQTEYSPGFSDIEDDWSAMARQHNDSGEQNEQAQFYEWKAEQYMQGYLLEFFSK